MNRRPFPAYWLWLPALLLTAGDALAWGLYTHVYFAQALLWLMPIADPRFRRAAQRLPRLVMAGACLPDLAVVRALPVSSATHRWETAQRLIDQAGDDAERSLALGFATHLLTDIYAHNHFVPAHELIWGHAPVLTHAACEWAMDRHVAPALPMTPSQLLRRERRRVARFVVRHFAVTPAAATQGIARLADADGLLRWSRLPEAVHGIARLADRNLGRRFDHYLKETASRLPLVDRLIAGDAPAWHAEVCPATARSGLLAHSIDELRLHLPLPGDVFASA